MEPFEERLCRFLKGSPQEIPLTLLNSIGNFFLPDLRKAAESKLDRFVFLGTHAVIHTIVSILFDKHGPEATKFYLVQFVDGSDQDLRFSEISGIIHDLRNDLAHQWLSSHSYKYVIDYRKDLGWWNEPDGIHINPDKYFHQFIISWERDGTIWDCHRKMSERELELMRYRFLLKWLKIPAKDPVDNAFKTMKAAKDESAFATATKNCRKEIENKYCV